MWENNIDKIAQGESKNIGTALYSVKKEKKSDNLLAVQCIICAVIFAAIYALRLFNSSFFVEIANDFKLAIESGINFSGQTPLLRFIDETVNEARQAAVNLSEELSGIETDTSKGQEDIKAQTATNAPTSDDESGKSVTVAIGGFTNMSEEELSHIISLEPYTLDVELLQPAYGVLTSKFGTRDNPITGKEEFHVGIDIAAQQGSKIMAVFDGQVIETGYSKERGNYIILHHKEGLQTLYQHLYCGYVRTGQNVSAGQTVGAMGDTGLSTGAHLHFELIINRKRVDPLLQFPELAKTISESSDE